MLIWIRRKITYWTKVESLLEEKEAIHESILYFTSSLFRQNTEEDILWDIAINCIENLGFVDCVIYLIDEEKQVLVQKAAYGPKNDGDQDIIAPIEIPPGKGIVGSAFLKGEPELISDVSQDTRYILDDEQRFSELAVPIITAEGKVLGVIDSEHPDKGFFTEMHLKVLTAIASICAIKLIKAKADEAIMAAKEIAEQASQAKSQFLSTMSHEIRTPLNAVIGLSHFLLNEEPKSTQRKDLETLHFSANHLLSLVNDILDYSKLESGKISFAQEEFDLEKLCKDLHQAFKLEADKKELDLSLDTQTVYSHLKGDSIRLNQILTNLIGNAIKFTHTGSINISYELIVNTPDELSIRFSVKDTGIGIPLEKQTAIFQQFEQASKDTTRKYGGTGLGLAICKKLVELQGGKIGLKSEPGIGTEFWFQLDFQKGSRFYEGPSNEHLKMAWKHKTLPGMKVLLVEDNVMNQKIASKFLEKWQIDIHIAENGQVALEKLVKHPHFDLILMDLNMPLMGGIEAAQVIRAQTESIYQSVPIIALTADVSVNTQKKALASGMNDYLTKPIDPIRLFSILEKEYVG